MPVDPIPVGSTLLIRAHLLQPDPITGVPAPVDPSTTLQLKTLSPSGVVTMLNATRQALGNLTVVLVVNEVGRWNCKWISDPVSGVAPGLQDFSFDVHGTPL